MEGPVTLKLTIISIALITLSGVMGTGVQACPAACLCYVDEAGLRTANCSGVSFISEDKFNKVFYDIAVLNIQTDDYEPTIKLWDDMFISFTKLKFLNLQNCRISYLPKNVFKGLKKVFEINLASNDIKHFDNAVFENIYALNKLNLRGNRLQGSNKPFISSSSLRELDLGYCGLINIQNEFFHGVKKLTRLYLDGNHLQTVKEHILPSRLTHLNLANNRIINVPISTINSLSQLRWLDLQANPINCTCALMNLQDILSGHATIIDGDLICAYPRELENMSLSKVNENDVCNKETFSSRYHFKKSQTTKYTTYPKKDYYFENEKYDPFEIQGDDPGTSTDDYPENIDELSHNKPDTKLTDETKDGKAVSGTAENGDTKPDRLTETKDTTETEKHQSEGDEQSNHNNETENKDTPSHDPTDESKVDTSSHDNVQPVNKNNEGSKPDNNDEHILPNGEEIKTEDSIPKTNNSDDSENQNTEEHDQNTVQEDLDKETTQIPSLEEEDVNIPPDVNSDKPGTEIFDENMKSDQVIPVGESIHSGHVKHSDKPDNAEKNENNTNNEEENHTDENDNKTDPELTNNENNTDTNDKQEDNLGLIDAEGSGGGPEDMTPPNASIPLINGNDVPENFTPDVSEEPIREVEMYPVEGHNNENLRDDEIETTRQIVDKKPISYEEMGPIIVVACIIVFITILVFIAVYKGMCKSKDTNRKPIRDVEASNGTELQDITSSLLPKTPVNDEKHNNKYPNEIPSPETMNLIKPDKTDEMNAQNHLHDLNQNDNKNDTIVKNGKHLDGSPPPIEKTKAKLTVLLDSIPKTPIFLQKRPTTVNNG